MTTIDHQVYEKLGSMEANIQSVSNDVTEIKQSVSDLSNAVYKGNGQSIISRVQKLENERDTKKEVGAGFNWWLNLIILVVMWGVNFGFMQYKSSTTPPPTQSTSSSSNTVTHTQSIKSDGTSSSIASSTDKHFQNSKKE